MEYNNDKFTERARRILVAADEEAKRFKHNYVGTEHILLGLIREGEGSIAARALLNLGVELNKVRSAVEFIIGRGDHTIHGKLGLTPRAKKVIELAVDESRRLGHAYVGSEHILLGLVREGEGIAAGVIESLGVTLERLREEIHTLLRRAESQIEDYAPPPPGMVAPPAMDFSMFSNEEIEEKITDFRRRLEVLIQEKARREEEAEGDA